MNNEQKQRVEDFLNYERMWNKLKQTVGIVYEGNRQESFNNHNYAVRADALKGIMMVMESIENEQKSLR